MKENKFQSKVKKQLESQAAFIINVHGHGMQMRGLPDLFVIHRDWKGFLELKVEKGKCSAIQRVVAAKIELRMMPIYVLRCVERSEEQPEYEGCLIGINFYQYTLENFEGKIIKTFDDLSSLLKILIGLKDEKIEIKMTDWKI